MGGIAFISALIILFLVFLWKQSFLCFVTVIITLAYAITGFIDDLIKLKFKRNAGLYAWQKALMQLAIAIIAAVFVYTSDYTIKELYIPFTDFGFDVGWGLIPIVVIVFLSSTNGVNLTDGLDGLAGSTTLIFLGGFSLLLYLQSTSNELMSLSLLCLILCGALAAFLVFNCYPAKVFMGDTGSMALGGFVGCVAVFSGNSLLLPIMGIMYVVSCVSVIVQVFWFKVKKRRVFLMSPFHHHLQMKGMSETRIAVVYSVITLVACLTMITFWVI